MSELISAEITIGGPVRRQFVSGLFRAIREEAVSLDWGENRFNPHSADDLLAACVGRNGVSVLWLCADERNYGEFRRLEEFLAQTSIPFRRRSAATFQFDAEVVEFRPGIGPLKYSVDSCNQPFLSQPAMASIVAAVDEAAGSAEGQTAIELLRRIRNLQQRIHEAMPASAPPLPAFEIVD